MKNNQESYKKLLEIGRPPNIKKTVPKLEGLDCQWKGHR